MRLWPLLKKAVNGNSMKKNLVLIGIIVATIVLAIVSVLTAIRIREMGTRPVAPSVPESKPKAVGEIPEDITPAPVCQTSFSIEVESSPTPTTTTTTTPGPSSTPTPGPSSTPMPGPYCDYLHADKAGGAAPLTVKFEGKGYDPTRVKGFRFTFGDDEEKEFFGSFSSSQAQEVSHTYSSAGTYKAVLEIMDDGDHWHTRPECEATVVVTGVGASVTEGPSPTEVTLPEAGIKIPTLGGIIIGFLLISLGVALVF